MKQTLEKMIESTLEQKIKIYFLILLLYNQ